MNCFALPQTTEMCRVLEIRLLSTSTSVMISGILGWGEECLVIEMFQNSRKFWFLLFIFFHLTCMPIDISSCKMDKVCKFMELKK